MWALSALLLSQFAPSDTIHLVTGRSIEQHVASQQVVCDDPSVVSVGLSDDRSALVFTGGKPGRTRCSFGQIQGPRFVVEVEVSSIEEAVAPVATKIVGLAVDRLYIRAR